MRILFALLFTLLPATTFAAPARQPATEAAGFVRGAPLPKWVEALTEIPPTQRTDPIVVRANDIQALVGPVPAISYQRAIQVNDSSALGVIGQFGIGFYPQYQKLALHKVVIWRGEQRLDRTAGVSIRPLQRETRIESGILGGATTMQLLIDDVRIGDTLSISYTIEGENPVFGKIWSGDFSWDSTAPAELVRLTVLHPKSRPLQWRQLGGSLKPALAPQRDVVNGLERMRFESRSVDEVEIEPSTPADHFDGRVLQLSEYKDWQSVASWAEGLFPKLPASPALKAVVEELRKQQGQGAQTAAALQWVQNQIRYFSVSIGENAQRPHAPDAVLRRRYGDCKDKSYLLISLLRELGVSARPVLLSAQSPRLPAKLLATSSWFDHVIVQITLEGRDYYVDPTRTHQPEPLAMLPTAFPGAAALVVDSSTSALITLPARADVGPRHEHVEHIVVADFSGAATLEARDIYRGNYADAMRQQFSGLSAIEQKNQALAVYEKMYPGVSLIAAPKYQDHSAENRIEIVSRFQLPKAVSFKDKRHSLEYDSKIIAGSIGIPDKLVRNSPFELAKGKFQGRYRLRVQWPDTVRAPQSEVDETLDNPYFHLRHEVLVRGSLYEHMVDYQVKQDVIPAGELVSLQEYARKLPAYGSGSLHLGEELIVLANMKAYSFRNLDDLRHAGDAMLAMPALKASKAKDLVTEEACRFVRNTRGREYIVGPESYQLSADLVKRLKAMGKHAGAGQCLGQMAFAAGDFGASSAAWAGDPGIADLSPLTRQLAWSQLYNKEHGAALASMVRYQKARSMTRGAAPTAADAANHIAFLQRAGQPLPVSLEQFARAIPDGLWPRPVLAMQLGLIDAEELIRQAEALPGDVGELALGEAWFYIGQARLAAHDPAGARRAFLWNLSLGLPSSGLPDQSIAELSRLDVSNPGLEAGRNAMRAGNVTAAIAAVQAGADAGLAENQALLGAAYLDGKDAPRDAHKAAHWASKAADQQLPAGQFLLATLYERGIGVKASLPTALDLNRMAALQGLHSAQTLLANWYRYGVGVERDPAQALRWFRAAAEQGNGNAMASLGEMYSKGEGVARDFEQAEFWTRRAVHRSNLRAAINLGKAYESGEFGEPNYAGAQALYRIVASLGDGDGQVALGSLYETGRGVEQDMDTANYWYRKAADAGNAAGQDALARSYWSAKGVKVDWKLAVELYRKAAAQGHPRALAELGYIYERYLDGGHQYAEAKHLYELAAAQDDAMAEFQLGLMYEFGNGVPKDPERMLAWLVRSGNHGYLYAQYQLAKIYHYGELVPANMKTAAFWYEKAARQGHVKAEAEMAKLYMYGRIVPRDVDKAADFLRRSAAKNDLSAQSNLGYAYERGWGVPKDTAQALVWYDKAAKRGSAEARVRLAGLYLRLKQDEKARSAFADADTPRSVEDAYWVAHHYALAGHRASAEKAYLRAVEMAEKKPGEQSDDLLEALERISDYYLDNEQYASALLHAQRAVSLAQTALGDASPRLADALVLLGNAQIGLFHPVEAEAAHLRAQQIRETAFGKASEKAASGLRTVSSMYVAIGQLAKAEDVMQGARAVHDKASGDNHELSALAMFSMGNLYTLSGRYKEAETLFQRALNVYEKLGDPEQRTVASILNAQADLYANMGSHEQSEALSRRALETAERFIDEDNLWLTLFLNRLGATLIQRGKLDEAERVLLRARTISLARQDSEHVDLSVTYLNLGTLYGKQGRHADAEAQLQHALQVRERSNGAGHMDVAAALHGLGGFYHDQGRFEAAEPMLARALAIRGKVLGMEHPHSKLTRATLAATLRKTRGETAAKELERTPPKG